MKINSIEIKNFRNISNETVNFDGKSNLILGGNAQGKTSVLEAIYLCAYGKSFRGNDEELIKFNENFAYINLSFTNGENEQKISISLSKKKEGSKTKIIKINNNEIAKIADLISTINIVLFFPDDLKLIKNGPSVRRTFLNREISSISKLYLKTIMEYNKVLLHRNALLKEIKKNDNLEDVKENLRIWDRHLVQKAAPVIIKRREYLKKLSEIGELIHSSVTNNKEKFSIKYITIFNAKSEAELKEQIKYKIEKSSEIDIKNGYTCIGPHRDDFEILINERPVSVYGSQGQQRTAVLSLILSQVDLIKYETGNYPILLLDDIMSELDYNRQRQLLSTFEKTQVILTTTELSEIIEYEYDQDYNIINMVDGSIK